MTENMGIHISPEELAELLGGNTPTEEQSRIISSPLEPLLVVAGAGSGKTATMTDRVVWLVANGLVAPEEVLGVTFTRKAAGELAHRVRSALQRFAQVNERLKAVPVVLNADELHEPRVSTYHSYANSLVGDFGLRLGVERDVTLMGPAQAWQLASQVVEGYDGPMDSVSVPKSSLVSAVITLAGECAEHLRPATAEAPFRSAAARQSLEEWLVELLQRYESLPPKLTGRVAGKAVDDIKDHLHSRVALARMVGRYAQAKQERGLLDYGDLVALAATIAEDVPQARVLERARSRVVILDEFQDTSHAQMVLFSELFGDGHAVTAVGDPNQSIYGFRGASAGQLFRFNETFPRRDEDGSLTPSDTAFLTTAWRNGEDILRAANTVAAPLSRGGGDITVPELRARPGAGRGQVVLARFADQFTEAETLADDILALRGSGGAGRTTAVLCRKRSQMSSVQEALERRGIPYEVVGLGGLLETPEIIDLTATLHVLADPGRSDKLMRLMAGARWRIGPADLMALQEWASQLARHRSFVRPGDAEQGEEPDEERTLTPDAVDDSSLIEALDQLPKPGWTSHTGRSLSETARRRLERLSQELRRLRGELGNDLVDLVTEVERVMLLDIEVEARAGRSLHGARRNLEAFIDQVLQFNRSNERLDVLAFLSWLETAAQEENGLAAAPPEPDPEAVQILTVHASKGLEWDAVFVPGLNVKDFPSEKSSIWNQDGNRGALPWPLRGDHASLPQWDVSEDGQTEWTRTAKLFKEEALEHGVLEERRLAYVAYTRAKDLLWVSSHAFANAATRKEMSPFLTELLPLAEDPEPTAVLHGAGVGEEDVPESNPLTAQIRRSVWPYDPLEGPLDAATGERRSLVPGRRAALEVSAHAVLDRLAEVADPESPPVSPGTVRGTAWLDDALLLLASRERQPRRHEVRLPGHISASTLVELGKDPAAVARQLRRPVPREPGQAARKGTVFHGWVEEFFGQSGMLDLDEPRSEDADLDTALGVDDLIAAFKASPWAHRTPAALEAPVETAVGPVVVRGRIDAVFRDADGAWDLVDWKTGRAPRDERDLAEKSVQLAVYRLAWSRLRGVPLDSVRAAFYYVADGLEIRPHDLAGEEELEALLGSALA
ncbi:MULTISPECIES: ATP-dependent DNA helicase [Arthrobacter]|uniref:DNA 3'-5' helicase n=2 Tax=Arthrobacter TaxID=1663 RepID=A0ABU9KLV8_9MICC|nr:ATP-dependent DNA helicase [Arthrobacter sp. YJM1]MDP5227186.1 ATP-dependent DNA helicase [Arthrobacter sp. YJM1]